MSLFVSMHVDCPECGHTATMDAVGSVNADRRPDLRDDILKDNFQIISCSSCGSDFRLQPEFNYLDVENGLWILALPSAQVIEHLAAAERAATLFATSYGAQATGAARQVGDGLACRLTFGWQAVREKILLAVAGLDDVVVELMKLDLLRRMPEAHLDVGCELRVTGVEAERLEMAWLRSDSEAALQFMSVERSAYDRIAGSPTDWAAVADLLRDGPFVDMQKLFLGSGGDAHAAQ